MFDSIKEYMEKNWEIGFSYKVGRSAIDVARPYHRSATIKVILLSVLKHIESFCIDIA
jgi:hypothetical protein